MGLPIYDPEIKGSEVGMNLYNRWLRIRKIGCSPEFFDFMYFYNWAMDSGFSIDSAIVRKDKNLPYSPDNCIFRVCDNMVLTKKHLASIARWNRTVNSIRKAYGMKPLYGLEDENDVNL